MLDFKIISLEDKPWIDKLLKISDFRGCEYSFANNMAWRRMSDTKITRFKDFYILCADKHGLRFTFPSGTGDYKEAFAEMKKYAENHNSPLIIDSVTPNHFDIFKENFPDNSYEITTDIGGWDYLYNAADLKTLKGKKYHGKRNHLKKLLNRDYSYSPITDNDFDDCITYAVNSYNRDSAYDDKSKVYEQFAINTFFEYFNELGLSGGVLRLDGEIIAFTIGEKINSDTLCVHIEKAEADIDGAYPAINYLFSNSAAIDCLYINREEDLGIEGLRKAKQSYHPCFMVEKHTVTFK